MDVGCVRLYSFIYFLAQGLHTPPVGRVRHTWDILIHDPVTGAAAQRPSVSRFLRDGSGCKFLLRVSAFCRSSGTLCVSDTQSTGHRSHRVVLAPEVCRSRRRLSFCTAHSGLRSGLLTTARTSAPTGSANARPIVRTEAPAATAESQVSHGMSCRRNRRPARSAKSEIGSGSGTKQPRRASAILGSSCEPHP